MFLLVCFHSIYMFSLRGIRAPFKPQERHEHLQNSSQAQLTVLTLLRDNLIEVVEVKEHGYINSIYLMISNENHQ